MLGRLLSRANRANSSLFHAVWFQRALRKLIAWHVFFQPQRWFITNDCAAASSWQKLDSVANFLELLTFPDSSRGRVIGSCDIVRILWNVLEAALKSTGIWFVLIIADLVDDFVGHLQFFDLALKSSIFLIQLVVPIFKHPLCVWQILRIDFLFNLLISLFNVMRGESNIFYGKLNFIFNCGSCNEYFTKHLQHNRAHFMRIFVEILFLRFSWLHRRVNSWMLRYQTLVYFKITDTNISDSWWFLSWRSILDVFLLEKKI